MRGVKRDRCLIVAGPTCSGKSALALDLAGRLDGVVINADSMQVYAGLRVLTAQPSARDQGSVPHRLYGVRAPSEPGNVAWWRERALAEMQEAWDGGRLPILCGGTGLYLRALTDGLARIPDPGEAARADARGLLAEHGAEALHGRLAAVDPGSAARLRPSDGQRIARAWEVWRGTGRGMASWAGEPALPAAACDFTAIRLSPPREDLRAAIGRRFAAMLENGALDEVRALMALALPPALPAMRAHGVRELASFLRGQLTLAKAAHGAAVLQGQYTKRQETWFAHHDLATAQRTVILDKNIAGMKQYMERNLAKLIPFVVGAVDAEAWDA